MIKYKTSFTFEVIEEIEITKETEKFHVLKNGRREAKNTDWYTTHNTIEEAKQSMIDRNEKELEIAKEKYRTRVMQYKIKKAKLQNPRIDKLKKG